MEESGRSLFSSVNVLFSVEYTHHVHAVFLSGPAGLHISETCIYLPRLAEAWAGLHKPGISLGRSAYIFEACGSLHIFEVYIRLGSL
jgi:hypothetical protein